MGNAPVAFGLAHFHGKFSTGESFQGEREGRPGLRRRFCHSRPGAEQALKSLINAHIEEKRAQFYKEEPSYHLTITTSGGIHLQ
jgi:hypothetical protein